MTERDLARECAIILTAKTFSGSSADIINESAAIIRSAYAERDERIRRAVERVKDVGESAILRLLNGAGVDWAGSVSARSFDAAIAELKEEIK